MEVYAEDPTPCPLPRYGISQQGRCSSILNREPSQRLGLKDAKPRRPKKQSLGWDPTVDIYDDTFDVRTPAKAQAPGIPTVTAKSDRRATLVAQPAQKILQERIIAGNSSDANLRKRRLFSIGRPYQPKQNTAARPYAPLITSTAAVGPSSTIRREARRRTIYVPSEDTTIVTIHPGASLRGGEGPKPRRPRRSDIFLDILSEEEEPPKHVETASQAVVAPVRRAHRQSLLAAPRRVPLQQSVRQIQEEARACDQPGRGDGKENDPPDALKAVKRPGKRAGLILPDKSSQKPLAGLVTGQEDSPMAELDNVSRDTQETSKPRGSNVLSPTRQGPNVQGGRNDRPRRASILPRSGSSSLRRMSSAISSSAEPRPVHSDRVPTTLSLPRLSQSLASTHERYPVITEDVADPSMYEDNWLSQQEQSMTQLINGLFERTNDACQTKDFSGAQSSLRQSLLSIYHGGENPLMHKRLQASLQFGALSIPAQMLFQVARFKDDFGQRQRFLDLWTKTYDLELLQTAAEVVIGRKRATSPRNSSAGSMGTSPNASKTKSVAAFLKTFLVYNQDATRQPAAQESLIKHEATCAMASNWRRTVLRSLMLIHLLDMTHAAGVSKSLLFQRTSPYKSSLSILQGLCRLLVPSVGDVARVLNHLCYHVSHVQYALEEYDYPITNLATDLRDGVRLTRLVETLLYPPGSLEPEKTTSGAAPTITMPCGDTLCLTTTGNERSYPLSQHLKYPCISRAQKVYNVQIALAALYGVADAGNLLQDLKAGDIVDGHREKSVGLLWGLVSRWGLESLVDFRPVEHEIGRLRREACRRRKRDGAEQIPTTGDVEEDAELPYLTGTELHTALLKSWAAHAARLGGIQVNNLSTSFADGRAYKAIVDHYTICMPASAPEPTQTVAGSPASSTRSASTSLRASATKTASQITTLKALGCSASFLHLFTPSATGATIPSSKTTIPLLAFLASRLLPVAAPFFAARTIQITWRKARERFEIRRRLRCVVLARACAEVVEWRARIEWAAIVIQRRWRGAHWL